MNTTAHLSQNFLTASPPPSCGFFRRLAEVYPEGNQSNNNQFVAAATGTISAIDGLKVRESKKDNKKSQGLAEVAVNF